MSFLQNENDIKQWLNDYNITNYNISKDKATKYKYHYIVNVNGDVDISQKNLKEIPIKFGTIQGYFDCSNNQLTELSFSPKKINGYFYINNNNIKSLKGCCSNIRGIFDCSNNCIQRDSLRFLSKNHKNKIILNNNQELMTLQEKIRKKY